MGEVLAALKHDGADASIDFAVRPGDLATLLDMVRDGVVSHSAAKRIFALMVQTGEPPTQIAEREGLPRSATTAQLAAWVDEVFAEHPAEAARYRRGREEAARACSSAR